ncbi:MAG: hypothetical protein HUU49_00545 [Candidatus Buchananbacteria bacterium]|nr:hypothetical protein [Candidatus Buchananbacteria bacterium]
MIIINRLIPWLSAFLILLILEQILATPKQLHWLIGMALALVILGVWQLMDRQIFNKRFVELVTTPVLFLGSGILFLSFLQGNLLKQAVILILALLIGIYLEVILFRFQIRPRYQPHSLDNISTHLGLLALFFLSSGLFSLIVFLGLPLWSAALIFGGGCLLLTSQLLWVSETTFVRSWQFVFVISLVAMEVFLVVGFMPTSINVNALIVSLGYYLMDGLARNWLLGIKEKKVIRRYLLIAVFSLIIILATAKWF